MDIIFKGRHTSIPERFRQHAAGKLVKIGKLDQKAIRIDVEVTQERNPRQSSQRERVELTIRSRGPVIRAEAAADDRYTALDMAFAKLEARLRRSCDRRKVRHADRVSVRSAGPVPLAAGQGLTCLICPHHRTTSTRCPGWAPWSRRMRSEKSRTLTVTRWRPRTSCRSRWRVTARWSSGRSCTRPRR